MKHKSFDVLFFGKFNPLKRLMKKGRIIKPNIKKIIIDNSTLSRTAYLDKCFSEGLRKAILNIK